LERARHIFIDPTARKALDCNIPEIKRLPGRCDIAGLSCGRRRTRAKRHEAARAVAASGVQCKGLGVSYQAGIVREQNMLGTIELPQLAQSFTGFDFLAWAVGWQEILVIVVVVLILFGGRKIPELARGIGRGMREFKREMRGVKEDFDEAMKEEEEEEPRPRPKKKRKRPVEESYEDEGDEDKSADREKPSESGKSEKPK